MNNLYKIYIQQRRLNIFFVDFEKFWATQNCKELMITAVNFEKN